MAIRPKPHKETNEEARFACAGGIGYIREEIWVDKQGSIVRYNLAFVVPHVQLRDNGRILGYDNRHGFHERHRLGSSEQTGLEDYEQIRECFLAEVEDWRRVHESKSFP